MARPPIGVPACDGKRRIPLAGKVSFAATDRLVDDGIRKNLLRHVPAVPPVERDIVVGREKFALLVTQYHLGGSSQGLSSDLVGLGASEVPLNSRSAATVRLKVSMDGSPSKVSMSRMVLTRIFRSSQRLQ